MIAESSPAGTGRLQH